MRAMMGEPIGHQERLFYEFDLDEVVPGDHLLRKIAAVLDLSCLRGRALWTLTPILRRSGGHYSMPELVPCGPYIAIDHHNRK
jgi:hypothetical protein